MNRKIILLFITLLFCVNTAHAGWVDDWFNQKTETAPGYLEGQKRGYVTGGSFSARVQSHNDYLATFQAPSFKGGCGGIDAFMGGFSFLNTDRLVNKAEAMIASAPAIAFDLALNSLSQTLSISSKDFNTISDTLNKLQLDDCKMSKAVITRTLDYTAGTHVAQQNDEIDKFVGMWRGTTDLAQNITDNHKNNTASSNWSEAHSACPAELQNIVGYNSVLEYVVALNGIGGSDTTQLLRGYIGDIRLNFSGTTLKAAYESSCAENLDYKAILEGTAYGKVMGGGCAQLGPNTIKTTVYNNITDAMNSMKTGTPSNPATTAFLNSMSTIPLYHYLQYMIVTNQFDAGRNVATDFVSEAYVYNVFQALMDTSLSLQKNLKKLVSSADSQAQCQLQEFDGLIESLNVLNQFARIYKEDADKQYSRATSAFMQTFEMSDKVLTFKKMATDNLKKLTYSK